MDIFFVRLGRGRSPRPGVTQPSPARVKTVSKSKNSPANVSTPPSSTPSPQMCRVSSAKDAASSGKCSTRSPSRIVQPKRYSIACTPSAAGGGAAAKAAPATTPTGGRARTPNSRAGSSATAPNTPKRQSVTPSSR